MKKSDDDDYPRDDMMDVCRLVLLLCCLQGAIAMPLTDDKVRSVQASSFGAPNDRLAREFQVERVDSINAFEVCPLLLSERRQSSF